MNSEDLYRAIGEIQEERLAAAFAPPRKRWGLRRAALAACLLLCAGFALFALLPGRVSPEEPESGDGPPSLTVDGQSYLISPHLAVETTLPEGFSPAGEAEVTGVGRCTYYQNPDLPEWVYVLQEVRTTGEVDESGTLIPAEPHEAYARYVDARLRGRDLLSVDGVLYISLWSADDWSETPDVDKDRSTAVREQYGVRIEGEAPSGFTLAGTAEFSGYDTIPKGALSSNQEVGAVYVSEEETDIVLFSTVWFTASDEETGETEHQGFDVYLRYEGPLG